MGGSKILVTGATGATGKETVRLLLKRRQEVRALVHSDDARASACSKRVRRSSSVTSATSTRSATLWKESAVPTSFFLSSRAFFRAPLTLLSSKGSWRITPALIEELRLLGRIGQVDQQVPGGGGEFHLIVLHHTDCGITRFANDPPMLSHYFQVEEEKLKEKAIADPHAAVHVDVQTLRAVPALPAHWLLSGLVYDVLTGLVQVIVPPAPIR